MVKCPECGSSNVRNSRHRVHGRTWRQLFAAWFRCAECDARFLATDQALASGGLALAAAVAGLAAFVIWVSLPSGAPPPAAPAVQLPDIPDYMPSPAGSMKVGDLPPEALKEAADGGDADAQYRLGLEFLQRYREVKDRTALTQAVRLLEAAAKADFPRAQMTLGAMYEGGRGVIQDYVKAAALFERAANRGEPEAMLRLGLMSQDGKVGQKDLSEAYVWLNLAAARGEERAEMARDRLRPLLSAEQLARAQERSRTLDGQIPRP